MVSHLPLLYGDLTAEENLRFYSRMYDLTDVERRVAEALELVGLRARRRDLVREFSRGMQQRLAIGRAVLHDPEVLLFDEPYTGLDQDAAQMLDGLLRQVAGRGRTVIMTSHDLLRSASLATRLDILSRGVIARSLDPASMQPGELAALYQQVTHG